eukprot:SAG11_NODE_2126_length_3781_cov_80.824823_4_plen_57_part_00
MSIVYVINETLVCKSVYHFFSLHDLGNQPGSYFFPIGMYPDVLVQVFYNLIRLHLE